MRSLDPSESGIPTDDSGTPQAHGASPAAPVLPRMNRCAGRVLGGQPGSRTLQPSRQCPARCHVLVLGRSAQSRGAGGRVGEDHAGAGWAGQDRTCPARPPHGLWPRASRREQTTRLISALRWKQKPSEGHGRPPDGTGALDQRQQVASAHGRARVLSCGPRPCCPGPGPRCPRCVPLNSAKLSRTGEPHPRTCPPRSRGCWARPPACQGRCPTPRNRLLTACGLCCPERMRNIFPVIWVHLLPLSSRGVEAGGPGPRGLVTCLHPAEGPKRRALQSL